MTIANSAGAHPIAGTYNQQNGHAPAAIEPQHPDPVQHALDVARAMATAGIPIFVARAATPSDPERLQKLGYVPPGGWEQTRADPGMVDMWRPGMALCAVMGVREEQAGSSGRGSGGGLDLVDIDPRNGGDSGALFRELTDAGGSVPFAYAVAATPSGGTHLFVRALGVASKNGVRAGIDVKAGRIDVNGGGKSRGFAFLSPTVRVSKTTGQPTPYLWTAPFDLAVYLARAADDTSGFALAALVEGGRAGLVASAQNGFLPVGAGGLGGSPWLPGVTVESFMSGATEPGPSPWDNVPGTLAGGRQTGVYQLACALRGRGGWREDDAIAFMTSEVWPLIDQAQGGHEFSTEEFETAIRNAFAQYPDGAEQREERQTTMTLPDGTTAPREQLSEPAQPMRVARELAAGYVHTADGGSRYVLRRWRDSWMRWYGTHWIERDRADVEAELYQRLDAAVFWKPPTMTKPGAWVEWAPTRNKLADVTDALGKGVVLLDSLAEPPSWLEPSPLADRTLVSCANGLLDVETGQIHPHTPAYYNLVSVPFVYQPYAPPPARWLDFLAQLWPDEHTDPHGSVAALQEWFGYVLSGRTHLQKMLLVVGPKRSGKGTIARILQRLVGTGNHTGPTLSGLGQNFGLAPLIGKPLAIISDARLSGRTDAAVIVERLLSVSGEDALTIDRKHREAWTGRLPTRFVILSNELPNFRDASNAITSRFVVLQLGQSWYGREDTELAGRLEAELPGILNWALAGLARVTATGRITAPISSLDTIAAMEDAVSPEAAFVRDRCHLGPAHEVTARQLFAAWQSWCMENGVENVGTVQTMARKLLAVVPRVRRVRRGSAGGQEWAYQGITAESPKWTGPGYPR